MNCSALGCLAYGIPFRGNKCIISGIYQYIFTLRTLSMKKDNDEIFTINFKISKKQIDQIGLAVLVVTVLLCVFYGMRIYTIHKVFKQFNTDMKSAFSWTQSAPRPRLQDATNSPATIAQQMQERQQQALRIRQEEQVRRKQFEEAKRQEIRAREIAEHNAKVIAAREHQHRRQLETQFYNQYQPAERCINAADVTALALCKKEERKAKEKYFRELGEEH